MVGPVSWNGPGRAALLRREAHDIWLKTLCETTEVSDHVMLPGMKQRIVVPSDPVTGQTIVLPARFGSVITASSGTSIHPFSSRTR
jgi:hypothetical protein